MISPSRAFVRSLRPPPPSSSSSIFKAQTTCQLSTLRSSTIQNQQQTQDDDQPQLHSNRDQPRTSSHLLYALAWLPVAAFITSHIFSIGNVTGGSMSPTFNGPYQEASMANSRSDLVLLNRWAAGTHSYRVGDIVTLISPMDPNLLLTKRILALPGDVVRFWKQGSWTRIKIPPGHAWLEGDASVFVKSNNLDPRTAPIPLGKSRDSREFGPVPLGLITSRIDLILWPPSRFGKPSPRPSSSHSTPPQLLPTDQVRKGSSPTSKTERLSLENQMATRVHPSLARILDEVERSRRGGGGDNANKDEDHDPSDLIGLLSRRVVGTEARVQGEVDSFLSPYHDLPDLESLQDASGDTDHLAKSGSPAIQHQDVDGVEIGRGSDGGGRTSRKVDQRSEKLERMRTSWNSLSRGGSLGDDAGP